MDLLEIKSPAHLNLDKIIETGSFYTPLKLISEAQRMIQPFLEKQDNVILFDSSVGGGAFTQIMAGHDFRLADTDTACCSALAAFTSPDRVFNVSSLQDVNRSRYAIPDDAYLVQIGNPPYNDTTSAYKNGEKGENLCDKDLFDRDLGISFLRSYDKLNSDLVCVLHPLAYLIKKANFKRLKGFRENYTLRDAVIFSSKEFTGTGSKKFPIMIGLYERSELGMSFDNVTQFEFRIFESDATFQPGRYQTTDGFIRKYPPRKSDPKESPIGLYYYTFRDINSLLRSASFQDKPHYNAIVIHLETMYHYAFLYVFRTFFKPDTPWLYGNLSPLVDIDYVEANRSSLVAFALQEHPVFQDFDPKVIEQIRSFYEIPDELTTAEIDDLKETFKTAINNLA